MNYGQYLLFLQVTCSFTFENIFYFTYDKAHKKRILKHLTKSFFNQYVFN